MAANQIEARAEALACDLTPQAYPFDAIQRAEEVEKVVMDSQGRRMYYKFRVQPFYGKAGVATGDTIGCPILCHYCYNYTRNCNPSNVKDAKFFSPEEVAKKIDGMCSKNRERKGRISGAEPFLGEASARHIGKVLECCHVSNFIIETNGILIGKNPGLIDLFKDERPLVRVTIKGSDEETFERVTGAKGEAFKYQIEAVKALREACVPHVVACMPQFVTPSIIEWKTGAYEIEKEDLRYYSGTRGNINKRNKLFDEKV